MLSLPRGLRDAADRAFGPMVIGVGSFLLLSILFRLRRVLVRPPVAWTLLNAALLLMGLSLTDADFAAIVTKPDNVAIVAMMFLLGYFTWLAAYKAVQNDERRDRGEGPLEALDNETVLVWPDLVYIELICMVVLSAALIFWALALQAPLEEPASSVKTPNPSKAPWYFVGLQEMLYYFDPWMAGVVLPALIIFGLMAIPYLDRNPRGNGYYTINERKFEYLAFQFGFLLLWILLILIGTFLRGPNWTFFGIYEPWDVHKADAQNNVNLSQYFWIDWLGVGLPRSAEAASTLGRLARILLREAPGILLLAAYFLLLPVGLARWTSFFRRSLLQARSVPLRHPGPVAADHAAAAHQDDGPLDRQPAVHRGHPGICIEFLSTMITKTMAILWGSLSPGTQRDKCGTAILEFR